MINIYESILYYYDVVVSSCRTEEKDYEETLLSKCENDMTNIILGHTVAPEYYEQLHMNYQPPPFAY